MLDSPDAEVLTGETASGPHRLRWEQRGDGPVVLLLHGVYAGASRYEWRDLAPRLAVSTSVRAADLLGAGASDRPDLDLTPSVLLDSMADLVADAAPALTVASSLTGAYALRLAATGRLPGDLALLTPTGLPGAMRRPSGPLGEAAHAVLRRTPLGPLVAAALGSRASVSWFLRNRSFADAGLVTDDVVDAHVRAAGGRDAVPLLAAFVTSRLALPVEPSEVAAVRPLVLWGRGQGFVRPDGAEPWRAAGAEVVELAGGLPQNEQPDEVAAALRGRLRPTG